MGGLLEDLVFSVARVLECPTAPLGAGWELTVPVPGSRSQAVTLTAFDFEEETFVRFTTRVGRKEHLSSARLEKALVMNSHLPHGCLALEADDLVMTDTLPLGAADPAHAITVLLFLARQADSYERVLFGQDVH